MFAHGVTVTRLRRQMVVDPYSGRETLGSWDDPARLTLHGVAVGPSSSVEQAATEGGQVESRMSLFGPYDVDVAAEDRIEDAGRVWQCDGDPLRYRNPFTGWEAGSETRLVGVDPDGR